MGTKKMHGNGNEILKLSGNGMGMDLSSVGMGMKFLSLSITSGQYSRASNYRHTDINLLKAIEKISQLQYFKYEEALNKVLLK